MFSVIKFIADASLFTAVSLFSQRSIHITSG